MGLRFVDNWHLILRRAWSMRVSYTLALVSGTFYFWPALQDRVPLGVFVLGCLALAVAQVPLRILEQRELHDGE